MEACQEDSSEHAQEVMTVLRDGDVRWEEPMHPIEVKQVKEIILVSDDVHASRRLYRETLGLAMPAIADRLNLARVGSQYLGAAQAGVMNHQGFTGRLHLGLEIDPADFVRAVEHLRRQGIEVTVRPQQPGYMDTPESVGAYFLDPDANLIELGRRGQARRPDRRHPRVTSTPLPLPLAPVPRPSRPQPLTPQPRWSRRHSAPPAPTTSFEIDR